ncbi:unnamed protein product [Mycena citricolor]|uniref:Uncharacterized protein n=1 Tax=Mycena citricolor TaxID=2018698 RepID=A0AAD2JWM9_9AGAR|nr:unnamed protein product [Mycena citricolor]
MMRPYTKVARLVSQGIRWNSTAADSPQVGSLASRLTVQSSAEYQVPEMDQYAQERKALIEERRKQRIEERVAREAAERKQRAARAAQRSPPNLAPSAPTVAATTPTRPNSSATPHTNPEAEPSEDMVAHRRQLLEEARAERRTARLAREGTRPQQTPGHQRPPSSPRGPRGVAAARGDQPSNGTRFPGPGKGEERRPRRPRRQDKFGKDSLSDMEKYPPEIEEWVMSEDVIEVAPLQGPEIARVNLKRLFLKERPSSRDRQTLLETVGGDYSRFTAKSPQHFVSAAAKLGPGKHSAVASAHSKDIIAKKREEIHEIANTWSA